MSEKTNPVSIDMKIKQEICIAYKKRIEQNIISVTVSNVAGEFSDTRDNEEIEFIKEQVIKENISKVVSIDISERYRHKTIYHIIIKTGDN